MVLIMVLHSPSLSSALRPLSYPSSPLFSSLLTLSYPTFLFSPTPLSLLFSPCVDPVGSGAAEPQGPDEDAAGNTLNLSLEGKRLTDTQEGASKEGLARGASKRSWQEGQMRQTRGAGKRGCQEGMSKRGSGRGRRERQMGEADERGG